jgi:hypothetical protein
MNIGMMMGMDNVMLAQLLRDMQVRELILVQLSRTHLQQHALFIK